MKVLGYARVSSQGQDLDLQKEKIQGFCVQKNYFLVDILEEKISGRNSNRPEWKKIMYAVKNNNIDGVVFTRMDRVARSLKNLLEIVDVFVEKEVTLLSIDEPIYQDISSPHGQLIIAVMGAIAEFEARLFRERSREGLERARIYGTKSGKPDHRPRKEVDWKKFDELIALKVPKWFIAEKFGMSRTTLYKKIKLRECEENV